MGGGGFTAGEVGTALDRLVLELAGRHVPRICFLPTASGDTREQIVRFHERFGYWPCEPNTLSLFHLGRDRIDPAAHLLAQDAIYVGGGSMRNMLAIWREHGLDRVMRQAWENGIVLAGPSAGAMCWFRGGISMSGGRPEAVSGLGFLPASLSVHRNSEPRRLPAYHRAVAEGQLPGGFALDDSVALLFSGQRLTECVSSQPGAGGVRVFQTGASSAEAPLAVRLLDGAADRPPALAGLGTPGPTEDLGLEEMRLLRHGRGQEI